MTIFDYLKDLLVDKKGNLPLDQYSPYIINRWLSFMHPEIAILVSAVCGDQDILSDKERHYKTLLVTLPKTKRTPKINYIKKQKETQATDEDNKVSLLAQNLEMSKREIQQILELLS